MCPKDYTSKRVVRYKTSEPVTTGGRVYEDWVYKELNISPFLTLLKNYYLDKYRYVLIDLCYIYVTSVNVGAGCTIGIINGKTLSVGE